MREIRKVVVLGANGTMGAGSAEVFAAGGCDVVLLARNAAKAQEGLESAQNMAKSARIGDRMSTGSYDADLERSVAAADLIFEAVAEDLDIKKSFFERVSKARQTDSIVATVSSGLSIAEMAAAGDAGFARHFLGIHLFNPPNVIVGTEVIPHAGTDPDLVPAVTEMLERRFGRVVTECADKPAFAGNRVGFKVLNEVAQLAAEHGVAFMDYVDRSVHRARHATARDRRSRRLGRAQGDRRQRPRKHQRRGTCRFRPARLCSEADRQRAPRQQDACQGRLLPARQRGRQERSLHSRPGQRRVPRARRHQVEPVDFIEAMAGLHRVGRYREAFQIFTSAEGKAADIARQVIFGYVSYGLNRVGEKEVVRAPSDVDRIMGFGFNWAPPTVLVDVIGVRETIKGIERCGLQVPATLAAARPGERLFREPHVNVGKFFAG